MARLLLLSLLLLSACVDKGRQLSRELVGKGHKDAYSWIQFIHTRHSMIPIVHHVSEKWYLVYRSTWEKVDYPTTSRENVSQYKWEMTDVPVFD